MSRSIRSFSLLLASLVALGGVFGCSNDPVASDNPATDAGLVRGDVGLTQGDFDLTVETAGDPNQPLVGPFVIYGRNIHYDDAAGALVADFYVVNNSPTSFPEPIGLTFVHLLPEGVEVLNPDNDVHGDGAAIVFDFANDDGVWTPGEVSLAHPVQFKTPRGQAVAFVARIDVGTTTNGGAIGGLVWHDRNSDGRVDPGEEGLGGVPVVLTTDGPEVSSTPPGIFRTLTDRTGHYRFDGLRAGLYLVQRDALDKLAPTTPTTIQVILVQDGDHVSDFLDANFGCLVQTPPDSAFVEVGDWVDARGEFGGDPPRLLARMLDVKDCAVTPSFTADGDSCIGLPIELRGPVTGIDVEQRRIQVMNSWLYVPPDSVFSEQTNVRLMLKLEDISIGDRVRAVCTDERGPVAPMALELAWWNEPADGAMGFVRQVIRREDGPVLAVVILDTRIDITNLAVQP